ncbi:MAG TPA: hypothetical protein DEF04_11885 [Clostridiales bacterium]|nr:hypothetical protein [Clostridiales bacterium]
MKNESFNVFLWYLRQRMRELLVLILFSVIFTVVFYLHNISTEAVIYAFAICLFMGMLLLAADFFVYFRKIKFLRRMQSSITISAEELPESRNLLEREYASLIKKLHEDKAKNITAFDNEKSGLIDYFTMWVHQIKTPIAAMRLLMQSEDEPGEHMEELSVELFKIEQYVEMVLQYLRSDSSSTDYVLREYNLDDIVRQAVRKYAKLFIHKKIRLDYRDLNCSVLTDEKWTVFVIEQILSNGLKYTDKGEIRIYMEEYGTKTLVIEDTGIGIKSEDLPRVFESGFTGYNGRKDKKSTGIGLYLCKRILKKLSHSISIESEAGKGTKVRICFDTVRVEIE